MDLFLQVAVKLAALTALTFLADTGTDAALGNWVYQLAAVIMIVGVIVQILTSFKRITKADLLDMELRLRKSHDDYLSKIYDRINSVDHEISQVDRRLSHLEGSQRKSPRS